MALPYNVYQFDFNGAPIGTLIDGLSFPSGITRDLDGSLLVTSMGDDKVNPPVPGFIGKYAPDGSAINASFITSFPGPILGQPSAVLVERSTSYWTGGAAGNVNWNVAGNWDVSKPDNHAAVVFGATAPGGHAENFNNFNPGTRFNGITFTADAPSYTLQGNAIDLAGAVSNQSANVQTIDLDMNLIEPGDYLFYAGGDLAISGNLSGVGSLIKRGPGTLTLAGDATYSGITTVADGTLIVGVIDDLPWIWVQDGGQLTATSIVADSLTIGGTSNIEAVVAVPEPSSMVLVLFGGMSIFIFGRRRHST
jgi:autotransporter-associated beta strand protein